MATQVLTEQDVDELLHLIVRGTEKASPTDSDWLVPRETFAFRGPGDDEEDVLFKHRTGQILELSPGARRAFEALARRLREQLGLPEVADEHLIQGEIVSAVGDVVSGSRKLKGLGGDLLKDLGERMARSVTVFPVAGLDLEGTDVTFPLGLGDRAVLGPLQDATEAAVSEFAKHFVGHPLRFTDDAWWTEDVLAYRSDPTLFEDGPPKQKIAVIAVGLDAVGYGAAIRAKEQVEAILGVAHGSVGRRPSFRSTVDPRWS